MAPQEKGIPRRKFLRKSAIIGLWAGAFIIETNTVLPLIVEKVAERIRSNGPPELDIIPDQPLLFGIAPNNNNLEEVKRVSEALGHDVHIVNLFGTSPDDLSVFMQEKIRGVLDSGAVPMYSWSPGQLPFTDFSEENTRQRARFFKSLEKTVLFRPLYEMNGSWFEWSKTNTPQDIIRFWRRIFDIFQEEGATNAKFVFSPNVGAKSIEPFYPGNAYVHFTALDIYDRYSPDWRDIRHLTIPDLAPKYLIGPDLETLLHLAPDKPFLIAEIGSMNRPEWVPEAVDYVKRHMPKFIGVISFEWNKEGQGPMEINWQMLNDPRKMEGFRKILEKYNKPMPAGPAGVLVHSSVI